MPNAAAVENAQSGHETTGTRERILRVAFELIGREGIAAISNRRLAAAAGVSLGSLTYHFPSQEELLRETLNLFVEEEVARMEAVAADLRARCPSPERVAVEVQELAAASLADPVRIAELELHLRAARDPALQEASRRCFAAYEAVATAALEALRVPDPERHARTVVALIAGLGLQWKGSGAEQASGLADALMTILSGARARGDNGPDGRNSNQPRGSNERGHKSRGDL